MSAALELARVEGLDLVEVAPDSNPPVCKIMDFGKFKYQQSKKVHEAKKKQRTVQLKEIKMRPKTEEHDYQFKARHARTFLSDGNKVKFTVFFRGREVVHSQIIGRDILDRLAQDLIEVGVVEQQPKMEGRNFTMVMAPRN